MFLYHIATGLLVTVYRTTASALMILFSLVRMDRNIFIIRGFEKLDIGMYTMLRTHNSSTHGPKICVKSSLLILIFNTEFNFKDSNGQSNWYAKETLTCLSFIITRDERNILTTQIFHSINFIRRDWCGLEWHRYYTLYWSCACIIFCVLCLQWMYHSQTSCWWSTSCIILLSWCLLIWWNQSLLLRETMRRV